MRTRSTGPCLIEVTLGSEDVTFGMSSTRRGVPSFGSWMLVVTRRAVPSSVSAVALPRLATRTSRIAVDGPARLMTPEFTLGAASTRSAST